MKHTLPPLNYAYDALEPFIDATTMMIHHTKHHQTYVDQLNLALDKHPELYEHSLKDLLKNLDKMPSDIKTAIQNHAGGHFNHSLFWLLLKKTDKLEPTGILAKAINDAFGSFDAFKQAFSAAAKSRFGSGWAWLVVTADKRLEVTSTANQDTPFNLGIPILGIDVWEHAYYLKYQNKRPDYIEAFWQIVNWEFVQNTFESL